MQHLYSRICRMGRIMCGLCVCVYRSHWVPIHGPNLKHVRNCTAEFQAQVAEPWTNEEGSTSLHSSAAPPCLRIDQSEVIQQGLQVPGVYQSPSDKSHRVLGSPWSLPLPLSTPIELSLDPYNRVNPVPSPFIPTFFIFTLVPSFFYSFHQSFVSYLVTSDSSQHSFFQLRVLFLVRTIYPLQQPTS